MIKVLIVEDSPTVRELLIYILSSDPGIRVMGAVNNGEEALEAVNHQRPDVITMDIHMPGMGGLEATRRIMETHPVPIVIVSGSDRPGEVATTFRALEAGALAAVPRPKGVGHPAHDAGVKELVLTIKLMSEVKVVRRWPRYRDRTAAPSVSPPTGLDFKRTPADIQLIAIGASTGGPLVIQTILSGLPRDFPVPLLIVQHMVSDFIPGFAKWLNETSNLKVLMAAHGDEALPGHVYVAPGGFQMGVGTHRKILLTRTEPENGHCPSVSYLFRSVAEVLGGRAAGVLLTGMGKDGAEELKLLRERGAVTLAQDQETAVVHGMPGEAIRLDAATYVLPATRMAAALISLVNKGDFYREHREKNGQ
jgi:two-component system chemotaxis response regulator CheB